jgi:hypothetical protein
MLNKQLQDVLAGKVTTDDIKATVADQAATLYGSNPALAQFLTSGKGSTTQWAAPYISTAANLLGVNAASIDLTDPQWSFILKPTTNSATGQSTGQALTIDGLEQKVKTDPVFGYSKTPNGVSEYQNMIDNLRSAFTGGGVTT